MENNELMHHGVRGMKWGIRRYQNRDGTLTAAGKKRYTKELEKLREEAKVVKNREETKAKIDKLDAKRAALEERKRALDGKQAKTEKAEKPKKPAPKEEPVDPRKKPVGEMTDAELKSAVDRLVLENQYQKLNPQTVSRGKRFMNVVGKDVVAPALVAAGKKALTNVFDDAFGVVTSKLGDEVKKASNTTKKAAEKTKAKKSNDDDDAETPAPGKSKTKSSANTNPNTRNTWVYDDDWWNTPGPRDSSTPALPAPDKKKKRR